jgi:hypothetical protein
VAVADIVQTGRITAAVSSKTPRRNRRRMTVAATSHGSRNSRIIFRGSGAG